MDSAALVPCCRGYLAACELLLVLMDSLFSVAQVAARAESLSGQGSDKAEEFLLDLLWSTRTFALRIRVSGCK